MSRLALVFAAIAFLGLAAGAVAQAGNPFESTVAAPAQNPFEKAPAAASPSRVVMKLHTFTDPKSGNMPSHQILVPEGWTAEGGAFWADPQHFFKWLPSQSIRLTAPDGRMVYYEPSLWATKFIPSAQAAQLNVPLPAEGAPSGGLLTMTMPQSPEEWRRLIERSIRNEFPTATAVRVDPVERAPELDAQVQKIVAPIAQMQQQDPNRAAMAAQGFAVNMGGAGLSALAHYTLDGRAYDHLVVLATIHIASQSPVGVEYKWWVEPCVHYRAPAGRLTLELPMMMAVAQSLRTTPEWGKMKAELAQRMHQFDREAIRRNGELMAESQRDFARQQNALHAQRMRDIDARGQQIARRGSEIAQMYNATNANSSSDKGHESFVKAMREVTDYKAADGTDAPSVQLPSHYDHVYGNSRNEFILTNDGTYDPNLDPAMNAGGRRWGEMKPIE